MIWLRRCLYVAISLLFVALTGSLGRAADMAMPVRVASVAPAPIESWSFRVTPYNWFPSFNGSTTMKGRTVDVSATFIDVANHAEFPKDLFQIGVLAEARYGRFAILGDVTYMKLGINSDFLRTRGVDRLNGAVGAAAGLNLEMAIAEFAAAYEVARWSGIGSPTSATSLDLYAGGRAWWLRAEANISATGTVNILGLTLNRDGTYSASGNLNWVDPVVGGRIQHQFKPGLDLVVSGDVGGFGLGSKFSWQAVGAIRYEFYRTQSVAWSGVLGYKALYVDYIKGSGLNEFEYNMTSHGPIIGLTAQF